MSLVSYEDVRPWARSIKQKTSRPSDDPDRMPPWFIEKNVGIQRFKDDPSLTDEEIATIAKWVDSGAPRGNPADLPPPRQFPPGAEWTIGTPDLIVSSPVHMLKAVAADFYGILDSTATGLTEDRYVKAVEVKEVVLKRAATTRRAGDLSLFVVHHAQITAGSARPEAAAAAEFEAPRQIPSAGSSFSVVYEVGQNATIFPDSVGVKLAANSALNWNVHLHSVGTDVPLRIDVGFKFHPKGYQPKYQQAPGFAVFGSYDLDIPPNESNVRMDKVVPIPYHAMLLTFEPHLHSSGKRMCVEAYYPNGSSELLNCSGYNHNWVKVYSYDDDVAPLFPPGTNLRVTAWYDNTERNSRVVDPRNWKGYGNRSIDDMFAFLPRVVRLTEEQFKEEVARRSAKAREAVRLKEEDVARQAAKR